MMNDPANIKPVMYHVQRPKGRISLSTLAILSASVLSL